MATDQEMRAWARENGIDVPARGKISDDVRASFAEAHRQILAADLPDGAVPETPPRVAAVTPAPESPVAKLKAKLIPKPESSRLTPRSTKRVPLDGFGTAVWGFLAKLTQPAGLPATGNMLRFQAPFAGVLIEKSIQGTIVDRMIQPVARVHEALAPIGSLLAAPMLVGMIERNPAMLPMLAPMLEDAVISMYAVAGPELKKAQERREKVREELGIEGISKVLADVFGLRVEEWDAMVSPDPEELGVPVAA